MNYWVIKNSPDLISDVAITDRCNSQNQKLLEVLNNFKLWERALRTAF